MIILKKPEITIVLVYQVYLYIIKKKTLWGDYSDYYCESLPYNHGNLW